MFVFSIIFVVSLPIDAMNGIVNRAPPTSRFTPLTQKILGMVARLRLWIGSCERSALRLDTDVPGHYVLALVAPPASRAPATTSCVRRQRVQYASLAGPVHRLPGT
jgi:hypothetical protein